MTMTCEDWLRHENERLQADLAAAQRELAAYKKAVMEFSELPEPQLSRIAGIQIRGRVAELLAQEDVPAQPQYREPTIEDARELIIWSCAMNTEQLSQALCKFNFVRKVQP